MTDILAHIPPCFKHTSSAILVTLWSRSGSPLSWVALVVYMWLPYCHRRSGVAKLAGKMAETCHLQVPRAVCRPVCRTSLQLTGRHGKMRTSRKRSRHLGKLLSCVSPHSVLRCVSQTWRVLFSFAFHPLFLCLAQACSTEPVFPLPLHLHFLNKLFVTISACLVRFFFETRRSWSIFEWWAFSQGSALWC